MEREAKFRGKRKLNGEWVYGSYIQIGNDWCCIVPSKTEYDEVGLNTTRVISETVGEFTGLTDKNNKPIYEGDILQCYYGGSKHGAVEQVEFKDGAFILRHRATPISVYLEYDGTYTTDIEVIGNIYENPTS